MNMEADTAKYIFDSVVKRLEALARMLFVARNTNEAVKIATILGTAKNSVSSYAPWSMPPNMPRQEMPALTDNILSDPQLKRVVEVSWLAVQDTIERSVSVYHDVVQGSTASASSLASILSILEPFKRFESSEVLHPLARLELERGSERVGADADALSSESPFGRDHQSGTGSSPLPNSHHPNQNRYRNENGDENLQHTPPIGTEGASTEIPSSGPDYTSAVEPSPVPTESNDPWAALDNSIGNFENETGSHSLDNSNNRDYIPTNTQEQEQKDSEATGGIDVDVVTEAADGSNSNIGEDENSDTDTGVIDEAAVWEAMDQHLAAVGGMMTNNIGDISGRRFDSPGVIAGRVNEGYQMKNQGGGGGGGMGMNMGDSNLNLKPNLNSQSPHMRGSNNSPKQNQSPSRPSASSPSGQGQGQAQEHRARPRGAVGPAPARATDAMRDVLIQWWRKRREGDFKDIDLIDSSTKMDHGARMVRFWQYLKDESRATPKRREFELLLMATKDELDLLRLEKERNICKVRNLTTLEKLLADEDQPRIRRLGKTKLNTAALKRLGGAFEESIVFMYDDQKSLLTTSGGGSRSSGLTVFSGQGGQSIGSAASAAVSALSTRGIYVLNEMQAHYKQLLGLLKTRPQVLAPLYVHADSKEFSQLQLAIDHMFDDCLDPNELLPYYYFVDSVLDIQMADSTAPADFLRTDSRVTKLLAAFSRRRSPRQHLRRALQNSITPLLSEEIDLEVDPKKMKEFQLSGASTAASMGSRHSPSRRGGGGGGGRGNGDHGGPNGTGYMTMRGKRDLDRENMNTTTTTTTTNTSDNDVTGNDNEFISTRVRSIARAESKSRPLSIDAASLDRDQLVRDRLELLSKHCESVLLGIVTALPYMPFGLRWICRRMIKLARRHFPSMQVFEERQLLASFIFLRYLSPGIVRPDLTGVLASSTVNPSALMTPTARRNLVLIAKVLQALANECPFGSKEQFLVPLNSFIQRCLPLFAAYLDALVDINDDPIAGLGGNFLSQPDSQFGQWLSQKRPTLLKPNDLFCVHRALDSQKQIVEKRSLSVFSRRESTVKVSSVSGEQEEEHDESVSLVPGNHRFKSVTLTSPQYCDVCQNFMWGIVKHGLRCVKCRLLCHYKCKEKAPHNCDARFFSFEMMVKGTESGVGGLGLSTGSNSSSSSKMDGYDKSKGESKGKGKLNRRDNDIEIKSANLIWSLLDEMGPGPAKIPAQLEQPILIRSLPESERDWLVETPLDTPSDSVFIQAAANALGTTMLAISDDILASAASNETPLRIFAACQQLCGNNPAFLTSFRDLLRAVKLCGNELSSDGLVKLLRVAENAYNTRQCFYISVLTTTFSIEEDVDRLRTMINDQKKDLVRRSQRIVDKLCPPSATAAGGAGVGSVSKGKVKVMGRKSKNMFGFDSASLSFTDGRVTFGYQLRKLFKHSIVVHGPPGYPVPPSESKTGGGHVKFMAVPGSQSGEVWNAVGGDVENENEKVKEFSLPVSMVLSLDGKEDREHTLDIFKLLEKLSEGPQMALSGFVFQLPTLIMFLSLHFLPRKE